MARLPRNVVPGQALHIIQRGNNRQPCFFADDDYRFYLDCLEDAATRYGAKVHAYVLMTNHVHLLLTPQFEPTPSMLLQSVGRRYVRYIITSTDVAEPCGRVGTNRRSSIPTVTFSPAAATSSSIRCEPGW